MFFLFALFIGMPILEIWLLLQVGSVVGTVPTIALVVATGVIGGWLARREGLKTMKAFVGEANQGVLPGRALFDGLAIFAGGALLMTPGIVTDIFGFALLLPPSRALIRAGVMRWVKRKIESGDAVWAGNFGSPPPGFGGQRPPGFGGQRPPGFGGQRPPGFGGQRPPGFGQPPPGFGAGGANYGGPTKPTPIDPSKVVDATFEEPE